MSDTFPNLTDEERAALQAFAEKYARVEGGWKEHLSILWSTGGDTQEPGGNHLRSIRNTYGPTWLMDDYAIHWQPTCPKWERAVYKDGLPVNTGTELPVWASELDPPWMGATVQTTVNSLGRGVVTGFFVEENFLGVIVRLSEDRPEWHKKQRNGDPVVHLFGPEIKPV